MLPNEPERPHERRSVVRAGFCVCRTERAAVATIEGTADVVPASPRRRVREHHPRAGRPPGRHPRVERSRAAETFDDISAGLRELRAKAGYPSFTDLVLTIAQHRQARGIPASAARPGRTTVYDAFREGRSRIDAALVGEIVRALGCDEAQALEWEERCRLARRTAERGRPAAVGARPAVEVPATAADSPGPEPEPAAEPEPLAGEADRAGLGVRAAVLVILGCVVLNMLGRGLVSVLDLPLHLDMVGTAIAALALGPWSGALVGAATNVVGMSTDGTASLAFLPVNVIGGLMWGYGFHRMGMGRSLPRFFGLTLVTALTCSLIASPILLLYGGSVGHGDDATMLQLEAITGHLTTAVFASNVIYSVADKILSAFVALVALDWLRQRPSRPATLRPS
ncbi:ECF transporter S component [Actinomycetota bacterium]